MSMNGGNNGRLGATIGAKITARIVEAHALSRARNIGVVTREIEAVMGRFWKQVDREAQAAVLPILRPILESPELPGDLRQALQAAATPQGQWQAFLAQNIAGTTVSVGLGSLLNNLLAGPVQEQLSRLPNAILDPVTAAAAAARGIEWSRRAVDEAARSAISGDRFTVLRELNQQRLSPPEAIAARHRGAITEPELIHGLRRLGYDDQAIHALIRLGRMVLTPELLAQMWNRNIVDTAEGRRIAAQSGMEAEDFDRLTELGGEPLSPMELGEAFRRGFIDQARFRRGIVQGPIRNEWFDVVEALQDRRMSPQDAAQAVLQGKMDLGAGQQVARAAGLNAADFAIIVESTGQPPGIATLHEAWNRDIIDEREFEVAFLESNLKNRHIDTLKALRFRTLPREQINITYRNGGFTRAEALLRYKWAGFLPSDAEAMIRTEDSRQLGTEKQLSVSTVLELYEARTISRGDTIDFLDAMGYSDDNIALLLAVRDIRADRRRQQLAISRVRARYIAFKADETQAVIALDNLGVPPSERDELLDTWVIEREVSVPSLTVSQVQQALRRALIDVDGALRRIRELGYDDEDANILVRLATPATAEG